MVYSKTQQSMGEKGMVNSVTYRFFTSFKHLMVLLNLCSGINFYTLSKILVAYKAMQLRFF